MQKQVSLVSSEQAAIGEAAAVPGHTAGAVFHLLQWSLLGFLFGDWTLRRMQWPQAGAKKASQGRAKGGSGESNALTELSHHGSMAKKTVTCFVCENNHFANSNPDCRASWMEEPRQLPLALQIVSVSVICRVCSLRYPPLNARL